MATFCLKADLYQRLLDQFERFLDQQEANDEEDSIEHEAYLTLDFLHNYLWDITHVQLECRGHQEGLRLTELRRIQHLQLIRWQRPELMQSLERFRDQLEWLTVTHARRLGLQQLLVGPTGSKTMGKPYWPKLQRLFLPSNGLSRIKAITYTPNLVQVNLSCNDQVDLLDFTDLVSLKFIIISFNRLQCLPTVPMRNLFLCLDMHMSYVSEWLLLDSVMECNYEDLQPAGSPFPIVLRSPLGQWQRQIGDHVHQGHHQSCACTRHLHRSLCHDNQV